MRIQVAKLQESDDGASEERRRRERTRAHGVSRGSSKGIRWSPERGETTTFGRVRPGCIAPAGALASLFNTPTAYAVGFDRGAVVGNSRGSRGRVQRAHATRGTAATSVRPRSGRIPKITCVVDDAVPVVVLLAIPETMRPLRGRRAPGGGTAGRAKARWARPRATHGYFLRPLRGRSVDQTSERRRRVRPLRSR